MIPKFYKKKVEKGDHWLKRYSVVPKVVKLLKKQFSNIKGLTLLDAGCAQGREVYLFSKYGINSQGIEINPDFVKQARKNYPKLEFRKGNIEKLPYSSNQFDVVFCINTLFYTNIKKSLPELMRVLKKKGFGFVTVDKKIVDLEKKKVIHKLSMNSVFQILKKSSILMMVHGERMDETPFRHKHFYYEIAFKK